MTASKTRLKKTVRNRKQEKRFFVIIGIITLLLILVLFLVYT